MHKQPATRTQLWATALILIGLCCGLVPLFFYLKGYLTQRTSVDRLLLIDYRESPFVTLAVLMIYFGILMAKRDSLIWFIGIASFISITLPAVFISAMNFYMSIFCNGLLILTLLGIPQRKDVHYAYPLIALFLSAIFTPNINWASIRAEVSHARSDLRTIAIALESYQIDHVIPLSATANPGLHALTTPTAYLNQIPTDPFRLIKENRTYAYHRWDDQSYILISAGPNCVFDFKPDELLPLQPVTPEKLPPKLITNQYDPTNGTVSAGDIFRIEISEGAHK